MEVKINPNAVNQFAKGTVVYAEGDPVRNVALVIKGRVLICNDGLKIVVNSGSFLAIQDLYVGKYQATYTAYDDMMLYAFEVNNKEDMETILSFNKDYHGIMVTSFNKMIYELDLIYEGLMKHGIRLYEFLMDNYKRYIEFGRHLGYSTKSTERMNELPIISRSLRVQDDKLNYYKEFQNVPLDTVKAFYSYGNAITLYQVEDQIEIINEQMEEIRNLSVDVATLVNGLIDSSDICLFRLAAALAIEVENAGGHNDEVVDLVDCIIEEFNKVEKFFESMIGRKLSIDRKKTEEIYYIIITGTKGNELSIESNLKYAGQEASEAQLELAGSFRKILEYSEIEADRAEKMRNDMLDFINLKDKDSTEDDARLLRRKIIDSYYELYQKVFLKAYYDKKLPRVIDMFLIFGYVDERLLTKDQLLYLYFLKEESSTKPCMVYNIKEWLTLIYEEKKDPSKNEFDLDYFEKLLSLKKEAKLTETQVKEWAKNPEKKLEYEIQNMFRYNNRVTSGQISVFVPILHKDIFANNIERIYTSALKVNNTITELLAIDFSIFDRESLYVNNEKKIVKEYIIKRAYPDIILMPTCGRNGVMWQDITGKKRDSSGRFLLPIFSEYSLSSILTKVFGRFRWEICRSVQGTAWNNLKYKSLTSEYTDYLQFYRKNRDLSEEKKEKVKLQIQKGRNSSREVFVIDYEMWIMTEAIGAIKLNKPVREMMATYCPFSKEIRAKLVLQPLFEEAMNRYEREKSKKVKEIEGRYHLLQKENIELTRELIDTLKYYKEL